MQQISWNFRLVSVNQIDGVIRCRGTVLETAFVVGESRFYVSFKLSSKNFFFQFANLLLREGISSLSNEDVMEVVFYLTNSRNKFNTLRWLTSPSLIEYQCIFSTIMSYMSVHIHVILLQFI